MVGPQQMVPAIANLRASSEIDAIERQRIGGLLGGAVSDCQFDLMRGRRFWRRQLLHCAATEIDVELRTRPGWVGLRDIGDLRLKGGDVATRVAKLLGDSFLQGWMAIEHARESSACIG